jgi:hypothetical protein
VAVGSTGVLVRVAVGGTALFVLVAVEVGGTAVLVLLGGIAVLVKVAVGGTAVFVRVAVGGTGVLVNVAVGGTAVFVLVAVAVATGMTWMTPSKNRAGLLKVLPPLSVILLLRLRGAGGENCQWITASPSALAQKLICATRKSLEGGAPAPKVPEAYAISPAALSTTFCSGTLKVVESGLTVVEATRPAMLVFTTCKRLLVKVM